ncbi:MAG: phosphatidylcholine/phosphatidylserine synthase [Hyphomicrobiales bacterium]|nr:MAG: phosphatidylcholine/phosphatidylserine synthase [Hyphomicrobiales bacterium]
MDHLIPKLEREERRRRRRLLFRHNKIPVRLLIPNMFTVLSLCAGLTAIRMAIELRFEMAIALVVVAAFLDGIDGRVARALKAQSKFGAELDSLADFVNFGVAPSVIVFIWGLGPLKGPGWITSLAFALALGLRLARFNTMIDIERPKWQANYFTGMPAPACAITVLLPLYIDFLGIIDVRQWPALVALYMLAIGTLAVSTVPTFSGKLLGERIPREFVLPVFLLVAATVGFLVTYPYGTLTLLTLIYLATIPMSYRRYARRMQEPVADVFRAPEGDHLPGDAPLDKMPAGETKH